MKFVRFICWSLLISSLILLFSSYFIAFIYNREKKYSKEAKERKLVKSHKVMEKRLVQATE